jgi:5-methylcytosine-specific restriction protein A
MLQLKPLCEDCQARGLVVSATEPHHIVKVRDRPDLRLEPANIRCLCKACHTLRTGRGE